MRKIFFTFMTVLLATLAAQAATNYNINVGGVEVTSDNASYITGGYITDGYAVYNVGTNTLTLYNLRVSSTSDDKYGIHNRGCDNLTIALSGNCRIWVRDNALKLERSTTINALSGSNTQFITYYNKICANLKSYNYYIKGSGNIEFNAGEESGYGYEAIKGNGTGSTKVYFQGAQVTAYSGNRSALSSFAAYFQSGADLTILNNGSNASVSSVSMSFSGGAALLSPYGSYYNNNSIYNSSGNQITSEDIYISSTYGLIINSTNFPSENFRNALLELYPKGYLTQSELNNLTSLNLTNKGIGDMQGIEKLTALKRLECRACSFTSLNLNGNTALTYLDCGNNIRLTSLSIGSCTNLETLTCFYTSLSSLDLSNNTKLTEVYCYNNYQLTSLTLTGKSQLTKVDCSNCTYLTTANIYSNSALTTLDASACTALTTLNCYSNNLTTLNVTGNAALKTLKCYYNSNLATIYGFADCTAITYLDCEYCALTNLSAVNSMSNLEYLRCNNNKISSLTVTNKSKLTTVYAWSNPNLTTANIYSNSALTNLSIYSCPALTTLKCYSNNLSSLNLSSNTALKTLYCYYNSNLATITGLANCTAITDLQCFGCALTDLSACNSMTNLATLHCSNNKITSLTLTNKTKLATVYAYENPNLTTANIYYNSALTSLSIYSCPALTTLNCYDNKLSSLNVSNCSALEYLMCYNNQLTSLNVSSLTNLYSLQCYSNQLTTLTMNNNNNLRYIDCNSNKLTSLNASGNTALYELNCYSNQLTTLSVQGCSGLDVIRCYDNKLTSLSLQGCSVIRVLTCYKNQITASGMTTLVNSLPTRSSSGPGYLNVLYNTGEGNVFNASHLNTAQAKYWNSRKYDGSNWVNITASTRGDVDGDSNVNIDDVTALIDYLLGTNSNINQQGADCDQSGDISIDDVTALIDYLLTGSW